MAIPPNENRGATVIVAISVFYAIALILCLSRLILRLQERKLGIDDPFLAFGMLCTTGLFIATIYGIHTGIGRHINYLTLDQLQNAAKTGLMIEEFYVWGTTSIRISICLMIMRIIGSTNKHWRIGLSVLIASLCVFSITSTCFNYLQCRPIRALWDYSMPRDLCVGREKLRDWMITASALYFLTDIILAVIPIFVVKNLLWPWREKCVIIFLMGLGLLASAAIIPKMIQQQNLTTEYDLTWKTAELVMWTNIEPCLGIIAISIPALRRLFITKFQWLSASAFNSARESRQSRSNRSDGSGEDKLNSSSELETRNIQSSGTAFSG